MVNESAAGRDGFILSMGRRIYHVYKQSFPMEFIYGLAPDANRETSDRLIDVRSLPEKYRRRDVEVNWLEVPKRSFAKRLREQLKAHAMAFASAIHDGYDLEAHVERENEASLREAAQYQAERRAREAENSKNGGCPCCGEAVCDIPF